MNNARWFSYERAVVFAMFVFGALLFAATFRIDVSTTAPGDVGPAFVPRIFAALLMLCAGLALFLTKMTSDENKHPIDLATVAMLALVIAYAIAMPLLGYVLSTFLTMVVALLIVRGGGWWRIGAFAIGMTAGTWFVFAKLLQIGLPHGPFGF